MDNYFLGKEPGPPVYAVKSGGGWRLIEDRGLCGWFSAFNDKTIYPNLMQAMKAYKEWLVFPLPF